jgi:hypothetical protein
MYRPRSDPLLSSVAVDEDWLLACCTGVGLELGIPVVHGYWPYENPERGLSYQDICVFERRI